MLKLCCPPRNGHRRATSLSSIAVAMLSIGCTGAGVASPLVDGRPPVKMVCGVGFGGHCTPPLYAYCVPYLHRVQVHRQ